MPNTKSKGKSSKSNRKKPKQTDKICQQPIVQTRTVLNQRAKVTQSSPTTIRVRHSEMVGTVHNSTAGWGVSNTFSLRLNPAASATFPWLSNMAQMWERYTFHDLRFTYVPRCPTTTSGYVQLAIDTDVLDAAPPDEQAFMAYERSVDLPCWKAGDLRVGQSFLHGDIKSKYNAISIPSTADQKTYDVGRFYLALGGDVADFGKLLVSYDVTFTTPQLQRLATNPKTINIQEGGGTPTNPIGNLATLVTTGAVTSTISNGIASMTGFNVGDAIQMAVSAVNNTGTAFELPDTWAVTGATLINSFLGGYGSNKVNVSNGQEATTGGVYRVTSPSAVTIDLTTPNNTVAPTHFALNVAPLNPALTNFI